MQTRKLGASGKPPPLPSAAWACRACTAPPTAPRASPPSIAALDAGVTLIDSGDFYGMGHNEMLIAEALKGVPRDRYRLSVKFGALRDPAGGWVGFDARPAAAKTALGRARGR